MGGAYVSRAPRLANRPSPCASPARPCPTPLPRPAPSLAVSTGNLTELAGPTLWGLGLAVLSILMHVYCLQLQTYVLRLDQIVHGIALVMVGIEFILGALTVPAFLSAATQF